ncbi:MAG: hypothetical protein HQK96_13165 [Nitrospirae bacterium]|nr:hypothetical protein [Nitrospirota bacterium]
MDINGYLTGIALLIAAYAALSRLEKIRVRLFCGYLETFLLIISFILNSYCLLCDKVSYDIGTKYLSKLLSINIENVIELKDASFTIYFVPVLYVTYKLMYGKLNNYDKFQRLVEGLNNSENHALLITLFQEHLDNIMDDYKKYNELLQKHNSNYKSKLNIMKSIMKIFSNRPFIKSIVNINPYLSIKCFKYINEFYEFDEFFDIYLKMLIENTDSILYLEISDIINRYPCPIPKENKLLYALFNDWKVADRLHVWSPIAAGVLEHLHYLSKNRDTDEYNDVEEEFVKKSIRYPLCVGVLFFDIMFTEAVIKRYFTYSLLTFHSLQKGYARIINL